MLINRDTVVAIVLLVGCAVFWQQSLQIEEPSYAQMSPAAWPRAVLAAMTFLCLLYFGQSVRAGPMPADPETSRAEADGGLLAGWMNVIWCFVLFFAYLLTMPWLGMLVGGCLFVFLLLSALGGWSPRLLALHAAIALVTIGGMWSLFTFGLKVFLPTGALFGRF